MADIGRPLRRITVVPRETPVVAPEPASKPIPVRAPEREREPV